MGDDLQLGDIERGDPEKCPGCGVKNDARMFAGLAANEMPGEGDIAVCAYCGFLAIYTGTGLQLREATDAELAALATDPEVGRVAEAVRQARASNHDLIEQRLREARDGS